MAWTPTAAGQTLTSAKVEELASYGVAVYAAKAVDTARSSTTTATADPELSIVLPANRVYIVEAGMRVISAANAAGDFKCGFEWTNTADLTVLGAGLSAAGLASGTITDLEGVAQSTSTSPTGGISYGASTSPTTVMRWVRIVTGGSNVTLSLQWAQQTSSASATTLQSGSWLSAKRVD